MRLLALNALAYVGVAALPYMAVIERDAESTDEYVRNAGRYLRFVLTRDVHTVEPRLRWALSTSMGACCSPSREPGAALQRAGKPSAGPSGAEPQDGFITLEGGTFLMGSESPEAIAANGEGPVRK